jgi:aspartate carbamoyltransferase catalytic subunit
MSKNLLYQKNLISLKEMTLNEIQLILNTADKIKQQKVAVQNLLSHQLIAHCFFEPSTRTRLSFESAALRLGAKVIGFDSSEGLSLQKGETLQDTLRIISGYADLMIIRHPCEGAAALAAHVCGCPVINAGDGANQHPTQALMDLFTIQESQPHLDKLSIALTGDLKYGRTIHSFIDICSLFDIRFYLVAPEPLQLPEDICNKLKKRSIRFSFHKTLEEVIPHIDILYMTRIQQERFAEGAGKLFKEQFILTPAMLASAKANLKIMHPLPRLNEISVDIDKTPYAHYFQQARNGVFVRQALLALILNEKLI